MTSTVIDSLLEDMTLTSEWWEDPLPPTTDLGNASAEDKLALARHFLTCGRLSFAGGHPFDWMESGDMLIIAGLGASKDCCTELWVYRRAELIAWTGKAWALAHAAGISLTEAMSETQPELVTP
ncbi:MAG: hypothetical protein M3457_06910 [Chloroflexota bacterium]|nr:hypothetical protein [Chloroflexota bacterium]